MNQLQGLLRPGFVFFALAMGAMAVGGCASQPTQPHTMRDPQANFASFKTFGWDVTQNAQGNGQAVSIVDNNIRAAITSELKRKGYEEASGGAMPDLFLQYETGKAEMVKSNPFRIGVGVGAARPRGTSPRACLSFASSTPPARPRSGTAACPASWARAARRIRRSSRARSATS